MILGYHYFRKPLHVKIVQNPYVKTCVKTFITQTKHPRSSSSESDSDAATWFLRDKTGERCGQFWGNIIPDLVKRMVSVVLPFWETHKHSDSAFSWEIGTDDTRHSSIQNRNSQTLQVSTVRILSTVFSPHAFNTFTNFSGCYLEGPAISLSWLQSLIIVRLWTLLGCVNRCPPNPKVHEFHRWNGKTCYLGVQKCT